MRLTIIVCGYFKKYIEREIAQASGISVYKPIQGWRHLRKRKWIYDENRPWTDASKLANVPGKFLTELIEPIPESEWKIFKGDRMVWAYQWLKKRFKKNNSRLKSEAMGLNGTRQNATQFSAEKEEEASRPDAGIGLLIFCCIAIGFASMQLLAVGRQLFKRLTT